MTGRKISVGDIAVPMENLNCLSHMKPGEAKPRRPPAAGLHEQGEIWGSSDGMIRILVAEDDDSMRQYLSRALERSGYEVVSVDRGTAALPLFETQRFDLLLTDIVMPEMDGIELAQHVAAVAPETRVMFITGFAAVTLRAGRIAPEAKVLSKPFHLRDLVMEVDRIFDRDSASGLS